MTIDNQSRPSLQLRFAASLHARVIALREALGGIKLNLGEALEPALAAYLDKLEAHGAEAIVGRRPETRSDLRARVADLERQLSELRS